MIKKGKILFYLCFIEILASVFSFVCAVESHAVVLMYHRFDESKYPSTNIRSEQFIGQLEFLKKNDFRVWPLQKIIDHLQSQKPIPDKTIGISIDDAYASVYEVAFPILKKRNLPFTVFVATDPIDNKNSDYMSWKHLREMVESGVDVGNHSRTHLHYVNQKDNETKQAWLKRIENDVLYASRRLHEELGVKTKFFAYPYGEYNMSIAFLMESLGYVSFGQHSGAMGEKNNMNFLPRYPLSESFADLTNFKDKVLSLPLPILTINPLEVVTVSSKPELEVELDTKIVQARDLRCYAANQGLLDMSWKGRGKVLIQATAPFTTRRSRYNCTLPIRGRYYWYSHLWVQAHVDEFAH